MNYDYKVCTKIVIETEMNDYHFLDCTEEGLKATHVITRCATPSLKIQSWTRYGLTGPLREQILTGSIYEDQIRTDKAIRYKYNVSLYNEI
jgi:hypothetical protein